MKQEENEQKDKKTTPGAEPAKRAAQQAPHADTQQEDSRKEPEPKEQGNKLRVARHDGRQPEVKTEPLDKEENKETPEEKESREEQATATDKEIDVNLDVRKDKVDIEASSISKGEQNEHKNQALDVNVTAEENSVKINISMQKSPEEEKAKKKERTDKQEKTSDKPTEEKGKGK